MEYRKLGKTGAEVSTIGFGASPLGGVFGEIDEVDCIEAVHAAVDAGINLFDTSPFYGLTKSESVLGRALKGIPRDSYLLGTKVGRYGAEEFDFSKERTIRSIDESLQRLQVETLDFVYCHDIEYGSIDQVVEETMPTLRMLRDAGKLRFIGVSGYPLRIFREVLDRTELDTILTYCHYTLFDTSLLEILPYLAKKGVGIINASPLAMGLLTNTSPPPWHPAPKIVKDACRKAAEIAGDDLAGLALQYAARNPAISSTLVGMSSLEQLKYNLLWLKATQSVTPNINTQVIEILEPILNMGW